MAQFSKKKLHDITNAHISKSVRESISTYLKATTDAPSAPVPATDATQKLINVAEKLTSSGSEYVLSSTCAMFLERVIEGKSTVIAQPDLNVEGAAQSYFLDTVDKLRIESEECEHAAEELELAKNVLAELEARNLQQPVVVNPAVNAERVMAELKQSEDTLARLQEQQSKLDNIIIERRMKRAQAAVSLELSVEETINSSTAAVEALGQKFRVKNSAEENEFATALKKVQDQRDNAEALLEGLRVLTGIQSVKVPKEMVRVHSNRLSSNSFNSNKSVKDQLILPMTVELGDITAVLTLDDNLRLMSIEIIKGELEVDGKDFNREKRSSIGMYSNSNTSDVLARIVEEAKGLPVPQDIRCAIFALGCVQNSPQILRAHISELRKKCIVRSTGLLSAEFTLSAGVSVSVVVHDCYPNVPAGVVADSIVGVGGWTMAEVGQVKSAANARGFATIMELFDYLLSPEAFGQ